MGQKLIDETNNVYGKLRVLYPVREDGMRKTMWYCQCECGNNIVCNGSELRAGKRTSCGKRCNSQIDETNNVYGFLKVLYKDSTPATCFPDKSIHWICECQICKTIKSVSGRALRNGNAKSCGCLKSTGEQYLALYLNELNIPYEKEYSFSDLIGNSQPLRFDFAIFNNQKLIGLIEFQGKQHFLATNFFKHDSYLLRKKYDEQKVQYCIKNNIPILYIIPYDINRPQQSDYSQIKEIIKQFLIDIKGETDNVKIFSKHLRSV